MNIIVSFFFCPSTRNLNVAYLDASTRCFLFSFFFFYLVWWHLTLTSPPLKKNTSTSYPDHIIPVRHSCQVRAFLTLFQSKVHTRLIIEQASKCLSLFCRDAFIIILARTVRRRNRNRILLSRHIAVTWAEPKIVNPMRTYILLKIASKFYDRNILFFWQIAWVAAKKQSLPNVM